MEQPAIQPGVRKITRAGIIGLAIALVALAGAALSPWAIEALDPDQKEFDEVAVDVAGRIKDRLAAKAKGQKYVAPAEPQRFNWASAYAGTVVGAGVLAICIGVVGLSLHHDVRLNSATVAVGASAVLFQYALILAAALLLILLIGFVLVAVLGHT